MSDNRQKLKEQMRLIQRENDWKVLNEIAISLFYFIIDWRTVAISYH